MGKVVKVFTACLLGVGYQKNDRDPHNSREIGELEGKVNAELAIDGESQVEWFQTTTGASVQLTAIVTQFGS